SLAPSRNRRNGRWRAARYCRVSQSKRGRLRGDNEAGSRWMLPPGQAVRRRRAPTVRPANRLLCCSFRTLALTKDIVIDARSIRKLGLGTVQFGLPYGITNERGQVPASEAQAIVAAALAGGIDLFDTAAVYGDSESVLGWALESRDDIRIVSKLPP